MTPPQSFWVIPFKITQMAENNTLSMKVYCENNSSVCESYWKVSE